MTDHPSDQIFSKALHGSIYATIEAEYGGTDISEGFLYIAAIKTKEVTLVSDWQKESIKNELEGERVVLGSFWEGEIEYRYGKCADIWSIYVSGPFTFELMDETGLDGIDVDDGPIVGLVVIFRIDGDSPPVAPSKIQNSYGDLSETKEDDEFEGY
jgi:hypothetical protein